MNKKNTVPSADSGGRINNGRRKLRNDIVFISVLLTVTALVGLAYFVFRSEGDKVIITVDGDQFGAYSLNEDAVIDVCTGETEEQLNRVIIRGGEVFVDTATCPDKICAKHKPIYRDGESIVCLPHKVVVLVELSSE